MSGRNGCHAYVTISRYATHPLPLVAANDELFSECWFYRTFNDLMQYCKCHTLTLPDKDLDLILAHWTKNRTLFFPHYFMMVRPAFKAGRVLHTYINVVAASMVVGVNHLRHHGPARLWLFGHAKKNFLISNLARASMIEKQILSFITLSHPIVSAMHLKSTTTTKQPTHVLEYDKRICWYH